MGQIQRITFRIKRIMEKYSKNPTDAGLMADYMSYMQKYDDFTKKFDQWGGEDLNDAELAYYTYIRKGGFL